MNRKIFFSGILLFLLVFLGLQVLGAGQFFRVRGFFLPEDTWSGGHPGVVAFDIGASNSGYATVIDTAGYLSGYFWLGTVGWVTFNHQSGAIESARIICPEDIFHDTSIVCPATGYAWSENAGWIALSGAFIDGGSGVYYNPANGLLEGFGHSSALGYIPFYGYAGSPVDTGSVDQTGITLDGVGISFIGKIAIIGNIAGTRIYNMANQNVGYVYNPINHANILNTIRKNIALISRNIPSADLEAGVGVDFVYHISPPYDYDTSLGWIWPTGKRSIIVEGKDIVLTKPIIGDPAATEPRAIIALKDQDGNGGNIIITKDVERIYAFIYAEGSVYSGEKPSTTDPITSYVQSGAWNIPAQQLYIYGGLISKDTIGGSLQSPPVCPVVITTCSEPIAQFYDLNYFRTYDYTDPSQKSIPYDDIRFEKSSMIIEYNSLLPSDPPPGLDSVIQ